MGIVERIVEQNLGVYRAMPTRIKEDVSQEAQVASDYRGRLAYEMLQNSDDAMEDRAAGEGDDVVRFIVTDDALWIANTGRPLSDADIQGLCGLGAGTKIDSQGQKRAAIGHKGLGFKSVLEITDRPAALSHGIQFELAEDHARTHVVKLWEELGDEAPKSFPVMRFPAHLNTSLPVWTALQAEGFNTAFLLPFKSQMTADRRGELANLLVTLPVTTVLFLKHLERVEVVIEMADRNEQRSWMVTRRRLESGKSVKVRGLSTSGLFEVEVEASDGEAPAFLLAHDSEVEIGPNRSGLVGPAWEGVELSEVSVAVLEPEPDTPQMPPEWRHFHVFLPTAEPSPYPMLVNGAFTTDLSRQAIRVGDDEADYNAHLIREAARLFRERLLPELVSRGLDNLLSALDRDPAILGPAAAHLHVAIADEVGSVPLLPTQGGDPVSFSHAVLPPSTLDAYGSEFRHVLVRDAVWDGRRFPAADFCTGRWSAVAADHGALELEPAESLVALASLCDEERAAVQEHETGGFEVDPILEVCAELYDRASLEQRAELKDVAQGQRLFPVHRETDGTLVRATVAEDMAFYPPRSARHDTPLRGLQFMAHSICWGALAPNERTQLLGERISTWSALFDVKEFRFEEVMRSAVLPGLTLRADEDSQEIRRSLESMDSLAAICQLAGRQPKPDRPLRYQRLSSDRALFNLSRLPVPCRSNDGSPVWLPAYQVYFGRDWIGEASVEGLIETLSEIKPRYSTTIPFLVSPEDFKGLLQDLGDEEAEIETPPGADSDALDDEDEVGIDEDLDSSLESDELTVWSSFLTWIGVNSVLRPVHFHDVEDRDSGWVTTRGLEQPSGWAFKNLGATWERYKSDVLMADPRVVNDEVAPYAYELHDLEAIVPILDAAEGDTSGVIGARLIEHVVRNWAFLARFSDATLALVGVNKWPAARKAPQRALPDELVDVGDNLWLYRLKTRGHLPTTHGPRRPRDTWLPTEEVGRRFGRRGQDAGAILPLLSIDPELPERQVRAVADRLGVRSELSPSTFGLDDARLLCQRIELIGKDLGVGDDQLRTLIRPAYRQLFELLSGRSSEADNEGSLRDEPLLARVGDGYEFLPAHEVFYARTAGFRQRSGVDGQLPAFLIEADPSATAPIVRLFGVHVLEDSLTWIPHPDESPFTPAEADEFRQGMTSLLPELLTRLRAERSDPSDRAILTEFLRNVEAVSALEVGCELEGRTLRVSSERRYFVERSSAESPLRAFIVWEGAPWPPGPDEAQRLAMALADVLEVNLVETFLAFVQSDEMQRRRLLEIAGASSLFEDVRKELGEDMEAEQGESSMPDFEIHTKSSIDTGGGDEQAAVQEQRQSPAAQRVVLVSFEDLSIDGVPLVIPGQQPAAGEETGDAGAAGSVGSEGGGGEGARDTEQHRGPT